MNRIALIGAKEGPWTAIKWVKDPVLRVSGFTAGTLEIEIMCKGCSVPLVCGISPAKDTILASLSQAFADAGMEWVRVRASHPTKSLICVVLPAKAA